MSLRLGIDLDGTLADLSAAYRRIEASIRGAAPGAVESAEADEDPAGGDTVGVTEASASAPGDPASDKARLAQAKNAERRRRSVWRAIQATPDFWTQLEEIEPGAVRQLHQLAVSANWEVFFITQRPPSAGASVQRQTQQWLVDRGFDYPSVLSLTGARGKAAAALELDFLIDDRARNCVDVLADSRCQPVLICRTSGGAEEVSARRLNIGVVRSAREAFELLSAPRETPRVSVVRRILQKLGLPAQPDGAGKRRGQATP